MGLLRKYPTLLRAYFARAIEYRAIIIIWALSSTLPLVMMAVWLAIAADGPVGGFNANDFVAYFLGVVFTRRLVGVWVVWDLDRSIREGEISSRLLRPLHPIHYDLARVVSAKPLNFALVFPPVALTALLMPGRQFDVSPGAIACYLLAISGGILLELFVQWCVGCLAFWWSHAVALQDFWFVIYSLMGGQIIPLALLPPALRDLTFWLPFRYLMSFQVEIMLGRLSFEQILTGFAMQGAWVLFFYGLFRVVWWRGLRQYGAVGA
jgi:ABC-2 type transport system permease protein